MRSLLIAGLLGFAFAAIAATANLEVPAEDVTRPTEDATPPTENVISPTEVTPSPAAATPPATAPTSAAPSASEALKKPDAPTAEAETKPKAGPKEPARDERQIGETYFKQCMEDWEAATHMTKKEWARTCRRVVDARVKFMIDQMGSK
jgi:hypothetical protein